MRFMFCSCLFQALSRHMNWLPWLEVTGQFTGCISLCAESLMLTKLTILPVMFNFRDCCTRKKKYTHVYCVCDFDDMLAWTDFHLFYFFYLGINLFEHCLFV